MENLKPGRKSTAVIRSLLNISHKQVLEMIEWLNGCTGVKTLKTIRLKKVRQAWARTIEDVGDETTNSRFHILVNGKWIDLANLKVGIDENVKTVMDYTGISQKTAERLCKLAWPATQAPGWDDSCRIFYDFCNQHGLISRFTSTEAGIRINHKHLIFTKIKTIRFE